MKKIFNCNEQKLHGMVRKFKRKKQIFDTVAAVIEDIYIIYDSKKTKMEYISPNIERVLGITPEELKNNIEKILDCKMMPEEPGKAVSIEKKLKNKITGEQKFFHETIYCLEKNKIRKHIFILSDRTKEWQKREELEDALQAAEMDSMEKSIFLGDFSHDIRTPVNAITGLTRLLEIGADNPEKVRRYTEELACSEQHLTRIVNDVLDLSRIEAGNAELDISLINLIDIIGEVDAVIRPLCMEKNQSFEINTENICDWKVFGDRLRISRILINLLSNAVKYTPSDGNISLQIIQFPGKKNNYGCYSMIVKDDGCGMSEEYQKILFEPFTRENENANNNIQGTGLGMTIARKLVNMMGGSISVESELNMGSTFTVTLELALPRE